VAGADFDPCVIVIAGQSGEDSFSPAEIAQEVLTHSLSCHRAASVAIIDRKSRGRRA